MRIALLVTDFELGGTPLRVARLACGLRASGVRVFAGCLAPPGPVSRRLEEAGVETFACGARSAWHVHALLALSRHLGRLRPDLVHATLTHANVAARLVGAVRRLPVITSTATIERERLWHLRLERFTAGWDAGHIVNSRTLAEHVWRAFGRSKDRIYIVPPSLDHLPQMIDRHEARSAFDVNTGDFVVVWSGRFDPVKRVELIIRTAAELRNERFRFLLAGGGPAHAEWAELADALGVSDKVQFVGWQDELGPLLSAGDVFLFPSLTEGLPNAVLEAMAVGLPVVAADIPALRELAGTPPTRLMLLNDPRPSNFASALRRLRDDEALRLALGSAAASWARQRLDPHLTVASTIEVYERVLAGRRRRRPHPPEA